MSVANQRGIDTRFDFFTNCDVHRLPSHSTLSRFRLSSLLVWVIFLCIPAAVGFLYYGYHTDDHGWFLWAGAFVGTGLMLTLINLIMSSKLRCPLCMMPPLQNRRCSKHRTVKRILGSHRLFVAYSIIFKDSFRCPYCGEPTVMEVRARARR